VVTFTDLSTPTGSIVGWNWNLGDGTTSTNQNVQYYYDNNGVFTVQLAITDASGCMDTVSKEIIVVLLPQVPTAFTPNGDGHNDFLFVKGGPFQTLYFRVYNNWGQLLFETTDQKVGWDGTYKGEKVQLGVYVWVFDVDMFDGTHIRKTGDITILK
ncbi:MAG TPA: gliding motility-associated C-terminal domain-containing protein, partial [Bacteroidia bacterium]|nr:gliding motility-associated C-terminal domain-containing protein [Bacteroidia bacterium]